jgi:hypothetical protein
MDMTDSRNPNGTFAPGHPGGPGRPRRAVEAHYLTAISEACPPDTWKQIVDRAVKDALDGNSSAREWLAKYLVGKTDGPLVSLQFLAVQERLGHTVEDQIDDEAAELEERAAARREREAWLARVCSFTASKAPPDAQTPGAAVGRDPAMATLGTFDRAEVRRG